MRKQFSDSNHQKLSEKARQTISQTRKANGSVWLHTDGRMFGFCSVMSLILVIVLTVLMLATLIGLYLTVLDTSAQSPSYNQLVYDTRITAICVILLAAASITLKFKKYTVSSILLIIEAALFLPNQTFEVLVVDGAWKRVVLFTLPTSLLAVMSLYIIVTVIVDRIEFNKVLSIIVAKIAASHPHSDGSITTEEEWAQYIDEYVSPRVHSKLKKSLRKKAQKAKAKSE